MKLRHKLLVLPAIGGALLLGLCALVTVMLQRANVELDRLVDVRFANYAAAHQIQGQLSAARAEAYRALAGGGRPEGDASASQRVAFSRRFESLGDQVERQKGKVEGAFQEGFTALAVAIPKYAAAIDAAVGDGSTDPKARMASMQTADGIYTELAGVADRLVTAERDAAAASVTAARVRDQRFTMILWAVTLGVVLLAFVGAASFNRRLLTPLNAAREAADSIAGGDLRVRLPKAPPDELGQLIEAVGRMSEHLRRTVASIQSSADEIATASSEIASGNTDLSRRTEQQAANLQQTSSSIEQLTGTVATNADNARQANQLALGASEVAIRGGDVVEQVVATMGEISDSSRKIADIIGVIDGIAFQTNILALNAAVEAARAGEQGRGFSVVAAEVRSLAQRSAEAAQQIKGLITDSVQRVESGGRLVQQAGSTMAEIVTSVKRVTDIIGEISSATHEQSSGIAQVNTAVGQLDQMTQQNAALVEESAAAAESLREQARRLAETIGEFRLDDRSHGQSAGALPVRAESTDAERTHHLQAAEAAAPKPGAVKPADALAPAALRIAPPTAEGAAAKAPVPIRATANAAVGLHTVASRPASATPAERRKPVAPNRTGPVTTAASTVEARAASGAPAAARPAVADGSPAGAAVTPARPAPAPSAATASVAAPLAAKPAPTPARVQSAPARAAAPAPARATAPDDDWEEF
jgi:methyl-accepting chemotaxis protein